MEGIDTMRIEDARALAPLVTNKKLYDALQKYLEYSCTRLVRELINASELERIYRIQGRIDEVEVLMKLKDLVETELKRNKE